MSRRSLLAIVALAAAACARPELTVIEDDALPADVYAAPAPAPPLTFADRERVYLTRDGDLIAVPRRLPDAASLPEGLLAALFAGPTGALQTAIPPDARLLGLTLDGGVATVNLSDAFERSASGEVLGLRVAQVVYTLTEAPQIIALRFEIEGLPTPVIIGDGRVVARPVSRADYRRFLRGSDDAEGARRRPGGTPQPGPSVSPG